MNECCNSDFTLLQQEKFMKWLGWVKYVLKNMVECDERANIVSKCDIQTPELVKGKCAWSFAPKSLLSNLTKCELDHLDAMVEMANNMTASNIFIYAYNFLIQLRLCYWSEMWHMKYNAYINGFLDCIFLVSYEEPKFLLILEKPYTWI